MFIHGCMVNGLFNIITVMEVFCGFLEMRFFDLNVAKSLC